MQRSLGTYSRRIVAKSGKSENGQMAVNSGISKLILISRPGNSYANVSSGNNCISARGVDWMSRHCWFTEFILSACPVPHVEELDQYQTSDEPANVCRVRDAA